jgi:hypothetical protein
VGGVVFGHVEVNDPPAVVDEHDEDEEDAKASGGHGEEVNGDQVAEVVSEKRPPGLRGLGAARRHESRARALGDVNPELEELSVDPGCTPQRICCGHFPDEGRDLGVDGRAATGGPAGELGPVLAEASPLPPQYGVGGDDHEGPSPPDPDSGQPDPEEAIHRAQLGSVGRSLVHGELLTQGEVLEGELAMVAEEEGEDTKQVEEGIDHRAEILAGSAPTDQLLGRRLRFWRRTANA